MVEAVRGVRISLRQRLEYGITRLVVGVVAWLPEPLAYGVAGATGRLFFWLARGRRRLALRFLRHAYGQEVAESELLRLAARSTANMFKVAIDSVRLVRLAQRGHLAQRVELGDLAHALPKPPFLIVSAHLGCWEAGAMLLAGLGLNVHAVVKAARNPLVDRWLVDNRERVGMHIHPRRGGIRTLVRVLAEGGVAAMVIDQNQRLRPVIAPFFGVAARCERSAAAIALRGGYPVVVAGVVRVGGGMRFRGLYEGVATFTPTGDAEADLVAAVTRLNQMLERLIRRAPDQYLWIHDRFRGATSAGAAAAAAAAQDA